MNTYVLVAVGVCCLIGLVLFFLLEALTFLQSFSVSDNFMLLLFTVSIWCCWQVCMICFLQYLVLQLEKQTITSVNYHCTVICTTCSRIAVVIYESSTKLSTCTVIYSTLYLAVVSLSSHCLVFHFLNVGSVICLHRSLCSIQMHLGSTFPSHYL